MNKKIFIFFVFISFVFRIFSISDWTFLIYMEAESQLSPWVLKNINAMALSEYSRPVNITVQCHTVGNFAFRYLVKNNKLILDDCIDYGSDNVKDLVNAASWAFNNYKSKYHSVILWNHGFGILDPIYIENSDNSFPWQSQEHLENVICPDGLCPLKSIGFDTSFHDYHKGVLFRDSDKTYLTNKQMIESFKIIKEDVLKKPLDILGTDCCKMAMLEIGYQIKDYVDFLIGSQNCELVDGWNYKDFFSSFSRELNAKEVCCAAIDSYGKYYKENTKEDIYTLSAFHLGSIDLLVNNINDFADFYVRCLDKNPEFYKKILKDSRLKSVKICEAPFYTDLDSFYTQMLKKLNIEKETFEIKQLKNILNDGKEIIKKLVVANVTGKNKKNAKGISIYFPFDNRIDSSYIETSFAQNSLWVNLLRAL
ncbi:hypothetical protein GF385_01645 [Candidatus Dependentiae bacterium]|nr:hypothetical protein [Candidatus Dependentiae bacterium]